MQLEFDSERLSFRPLELDDLDLMIELWGDPDVMKYIAERTYSPEEVAERIPTTTRRAGDGCIGVWRLTHKETHEKLGTAVLLPMPAELDDTDWDLVNGGPVPDEDIEIGYVLKRSAWGQGYAPEACARLLRFAFEDSPMEEITACTDPENIASQHILRTCGLRSVGMIRAYQSDLPGFRITRSEWQARHS